MLFKVIPWFCIAHPYCARYSLDSEINASFLLNKHGDLHFSLHKNIVHIIHFNFSKTYKKLSEGKKDIAESVRKTATPTCKL